ncbi:hypothetical protein [Bradyrhizobium sp. RDM4]|uniref:hypothetical protein n=1 Tax=Bradyrhizobium sp. RDM4 TaxID=3378765 RepID=UPI0038FC428B
MIEAMRGPGKRNAADRRGAICEIDNHSKPILSEAMQSSTLNGSIMRQICEPV